MDIVSIMNEIKEEDIIKIIENLVKIKSFPGIKNQETETAEYINSFFLNEGIESNIDHVIDGRCNVIAKLNGSGNGKSLLLTGHTDTVAPYGMTDPFNLINEKGRLRGRGVVDMKSAIACMMAAIAAIKRAGVTLKGDLYFCGVIDEEQKSEGTISLLKKQLKFDAAIVGEPTNLEVCTAHRGLEWFEIYFKGKAVHGGKQKEGINAIEKASLFISKIEKELIPKLNKRVHPIAGSATMNYGCINGGTQPSTVAGDCILKFDRRWIPGEKYDDVVTEYENVLKEIHKEDPSFEATLKVMNESVMKDNYVHEAMEIDINHLLVKTLLKNIEKITNNKSTITSFPAWSDGGLLCSYGKIPTVVFGPGNIESAHSDEEFIEISQIVPAAIIYAITALNICENCD